MTDHRMRVQYSKMLNKVTKGVKEEKDIAGLRQMIAFERDLDIMTADMTQNSFNKGQNDNGHGGSDDYAGSADWIERPRPSLAQL